MDEKSQEGRQPMMFNSTDSKEFRDRNLSLEEWKSMAESLWKLLDDIDTASDMFKPQKSSFYNYVMKKATERGKYLESDGYRLFTTEKV